MLCVTIRKMKSYARKKSLLKKVILNYLRQKFFIICWHGVPNSNMLENAGKMAHFSFTYEKVDKTDSLQPSGCIEPLVFYNC